MGRDSIIERVKKCMALGGSSNPNEAAAALKKAQALMEKHGVNMMDVAISDVAEAEGVFCQAQKPPQYLVVLAHCITGAFGCRFLISRSWMSAHTTIRFIGIGAQPEIAAYALDVLRRSLVRGRQQYLKMIPKQTRPQNKTRRADVWALGWVNGVAGQVRKLAVPEESKDIIDTWVERNLDVTESKARTAKLKGNKAARDYMNGYVEGQKQQLHRPIDGTGATPARLTA